MHQAVTRRRFHRWRAGGLDVKHLCRLAAAILIVSSVSVSPARADTITFTYTVTGQGNINFAFPILTYSFVPDAAVATPLGPLDVRYQSSTGIDFSLTPPSGVTTATWDFGALGSFSGTGSQIGGVPMGDFSPFSGGSIISAGTGVFAGASGTTSYVGGASLSTGITTFTERVEVSAPGLKPVPEPSGLLLLAIGVAAAVRRRRRKDGKAADRR
jgi:hypothetical protein